MPRWGAALLLVVLAAVGIGGAATGATEPETCTETGTLVCIAVSDNPETVPPSTAGSPKYVSYDVAVTNRGRSSITHVTVRGTFSAGLSLVSATPSVGTCTTAGGALSCVLGRIARGAGATVAVVARSPEAEGVATATFTASFDEGDGPDADPKQDSVSSTEHTTVEAVAGTAASFVPQGASVSLTTDPTNTGVATASDPLIGAAVITTSPTAVTALIDEVTATLPCPRKVICRRGDLFHADIPGTFDPPLAFPLRWDSTLIPSSLNAKKFALIYTECLEGCPLRVITTRCSSETPRTNELPCLSRVAKLPDGDWVATLLSEHNGYMK
jgi:uncharacterized repeat protein (TIGR01451 family)